MHNDFYARFEAQNNVKARKTIPPPNDQVLCLSTADKKRNLCRVNPQKSAGPDNIPGTVLRECAELEYVQGGCNQWRLYQLGGVYDISDQLHLQANVFTDTFNVSLSSAIVPMCLKTMIIVSVPKKFTVSCLNNYHPVALTPIMMKCFERLVMRHTDPVTALTGLLAVCVSSELLHGRCHHHNPPSHLIEKLSLLGLNTSLCNWILDFLTGRIQSVRIRKSFSSTTTLSTGAPQGCVLSPLLFTLQTQDCAAMHSSNHIVKFADDTTVVGLISKNDESARMCREEVQCLTAWCKANSLSLNVDKTKEMVVDFRRAQSDHSLLFIDGSPV
ncbi:hypothetical protein QTP70_015935 [Hemibagrus guttatus]|uniref:Reverse transcriptase domain-containing protein n=1 Tax=Hemibagrus guttatus TaxID=175788 RepID=A0AAE0V8F5_9TELE|nr:hypothetical protein QTP70_015935 [Hemibagrus guttatus]KAK3570707.1 hypothetical protein QTP86_025251 [Hemibagrus guttatus]